MTKKTIQCSVSFLNENMLLPTWLIERNLVVSLKTYFSRFQKVIQAMREEKIAVLIFSLQRYHYVAFKLPVVWDCNRAGVE